MPAAGSQNIKGQSFILDTAADAAQTH
jgi:hypothetical protein